MFIELINFNGKKTVYAFAKTMKMVDAMQKKRFNILYNEGYKCYLYPEGQSFIISQEEKDKLDMCWEEDVFQFNGKKAFLYYSNESDDNAIMVTGKCNSNCIMCPAAETVRKNAFSMNIGELMEIVRHIPDKESHITITGGEPFLLGKDLFRLLTYLKEYRSQMHYLILTNGRIFCKDEYCNELLASIPQNTILGIPIHGYDSVTHDYITQAKGSFVQTLSGIKKLLKNKVTIEIRYVVSRLNMDYLSRMSRLVTEELATVRYVKIMGLEMLGNAAINKDAVWIDYETAFEKARNAIDILIHSGIDVELYNFPLCMVDSRYWGLYRKSISGSKVRYLSSCDACKEKKSCGGMFLGSIRLIDYVKPIQK